MRRLSLLILTAVVVVALTNVAGQRATSSSASTGEASLIVHVPTAVRPGLLFQVKITITAHDAVPSAQIVLSSGWVDGLTLNTEEPGASYLGFRFKGSSRRRGTSDRADRRR